MTDKEAMAMALEALYGFIPYLPLNDKEQCARYDNAIIALKARLADHPMRKVQRLGQEIEQEPDRTGMVYYKNDACKAKDAYAHDCICWTKAQPPQRTKPLIGCVNHDCDKCKEENI